MKKLMLLLVLAISLATQAQAAPRYPYSAEESHALLAQLGDHVMVINSDLTLRKKQPAKEFDLLVYYPLSKDKVDEYQRSGQLREKKDDIAKFVSYRIKDYQLSNEKNEGLKLVAGTDSGPMENFALWTYDDVLSGQLGVYVKLDKPFERIKGHLTLVLELPGKVTREVRVPVELSVNDEDPRPGI